MPEPRATYRLEQHNQERNTDTTWRFRSAAPDGDSTQPGYACWGAWFRMKQGPCQPEPFIFLKYDLTDSLRLDNTVSAPGAHRFKVTVSNGQAVQSEEDSAPRIEGLKLWTSTDGGESWERARVIPSQSRDGGSGERTFRVVAVYPKPGQASGSVSLKAEAWDADGNRVEQVIKDAFDLSHRNPRK